MDNVYRLYRVAQVEMRSAGVWRQGEEGLYKRREERERSVCGLSLYCQYICTENVYQG